MRPHPPLVLAAALALGAMATACSSGSEPATAPTTQRSTTTTGPGDGATPGTVARPEVLDAGDAPRRRFRLAYRTGSKGAVTSTSKVTVTVGTGGQERTSAPDPVTSTMQWEVIQADDTGAQVQTTIVNAPSAPTLAGVVVNVRVSARGAPDTVTIAGDAELNATARSMIRSLSSAQQTFGAVLPVEPVGIGASWRVAGTTEISGIQMATVTTYHLDGIAGDKLTYHADTKITAADQDVALSGSSGATAHLDQATITGTEHATMDLRHPGGASTSTVSGTEDLTMQGPDGKVAAHERITLETTVAPLSP